MFQVTSNVNYHLFRTRPDLIKKGGSGSYTRVWSGSDRSGRLKTGPAVGSHLCAPRRRSRGKTPAKGSNRRRRRRLSCGPANISRTHSLSSFASLRTAGNGDPRNRALHLLGPVVISSPPSLPCARQAAGLPQAWVLSGDPALTVVEFAPRAASPCTPQQANRETVPRAVLRGPRSGGGDRGRREDPGAEHQEEALRGQLALVSLRRRHQEPVWPVWHCQRRRGFMFFSFFLFFSFRLSSLSVCGLCSFLFSVWNWTVVGLRCRL